MDRGEILEEIRGQNPWWEGEEVPLPDPFVERRMFDRLEEELDEDIVTAVTGLRRSGKTTLLHGLIDNILGEAAPENVLYFSFDLAEETDVRKILDIYSEEVLEKPFSDVEETVYVFLDEVQKLENWADHVKSLYDRGYDLKFVVTGSASMRITKGAGESLVGRIMVHELQPFSFRDYCVFHGVEVPEIDLDDPSYPENAEKLRIEFNKYLEEGGFPELYGEGSDQILRQNLDLTLFRDVVNMFSVKRGDKLKNLFRLVAENTGQVVNYNNFSDDLDTQYRTVTDYLQYLEDAFLISSSPPHFSRTRKSMRKNPKLYVADHAYNRVYPAYDGFTAETVAFNHLKRIEEPKYKKDPEVDIVLPEAEKAFEVKYQDEVRKSGVENLTDLPAEYNLYMVSKRTYDNWEINGREIRVVPLWMLCLAL